MASENVTSTLKPEWTVTVETVGAVVSITIEDEQPETVSFAAASMLVILYVYVLPLTPRKGRVCKVFDDKSIKLPEVEPQLPSE